MTDWLAFGRRVAGDLDAVLAEHPTRLEREPVVGAGEGGDDTTAIDAAAERAVVARLEELAATGVEFTLVSEELGERSFGAATPRLVLDPIDGSMNAKRGVPFFSVSLAVADGPDDGRCRSSATSSTSARARSGWAAAARARFSTARCSRARAPRRSRDPVLRGDDGRTRSPTRSATWSASLRARG